MSSPTRTLFAFLALLVGMFVLGWRLPKYQTPAEEALAELSAAVEEAVRQFTIVVQEWMVTFEKAAESVEQFAEQLKKAMGSIGGNE